MRILQQHADFIEYEPVAKEIAHAEEAEKRKVRLEELVVLFVSVESGDTEDTARAAVEEADRFLQKLGVKRILIYPFAHLSSDLARPADAMRVIVSMESRARELGLETHRAPFGWNKAFQIKVKGHPLAEQSRHFGPEPVGQAATATQVATQRREAPMSENEMFARIKKSDFGGLPETDHRIIGERLDLFSFQEPSPGMVFWHDKGLKLRNVLIEFVRGELASRGYIEISAPSLANTVLWKVSGHWDHYKDNMFITHLGDDEFALKPMGCPSTMLFYRTRRWSFRDLPLRVSDFDALYRNELSGVATGLFRVKMLTQDDAHIFAAEDQVEGEVAGIIDLMAKLLGVFGLSYKLKISTMPDDHIGTTDQWDKATDTLKRVVSSKGMTYEVKEKEGAFYGPKIDVDIRDSMGREWQCSTIQLDYQLPGRFRLSYTGSDAAEHVPVVIHRAIYGSLERFIGILVEHYQGKFPVWLAPVQVKVLPISDDVLAYATQVLGALKAAGMRAEGDFEPGTVGGKIRNAQLQKVPYMLVLGKKEQDAGTVSVRSRDGGEVRYGVPLADFLKEGAAQSAPGGA